MNKEELIELLEKYNPESLMEEKAKTEIVRFIIENDDFASRNNESGHITSSSWIVSRDRKKALLTYHLKLNRWLQLGGHVEDDKSILESALREAKEESGLMDIRPLSDNIFDLDIHLIPGRGDQKEHYHLDIRFIFEGNEKEELKLVESESKDLRWILVDEISEYTKEESVLRMARKTVRKYS